VSTTDASALQARVNSLPWFHQIDFGNGVVSPGATSLDVLERQAAVYFKDGVEGKSVIDIGCWDGFNSFEARRRGATRVLATDHFAWSDDGWGSRDSFELARAQLAPDVDVLDIDLPDVDETTVGRFDVVLFCGVLYHLRDPLGALERMRSICDGTIVVETHLDAREVERPAMIFYPGRELADDPTNWWGPNRECVVSMLQSAGFARVEHTDHPDHETRGIFHGYS
jgi:tRNA (mo5U34)-methyltransferase